MIFSGLFGPGNHLDEKARQLTSPITFYESDVLIDNSLFQDIQAEDMLNIVRSEFVIRDSQFDNGPSDGVDVDFADGSVLNTQISGMGNDGFDMSGSDVIMRGVRISEVGDKGISVGEKSDFKINNSTLMGNMIGVAVKDGSNATINGTDLIGNETAIATFQKKAEFDGANIIVWRSTLESNVQNWLIESGSSLFFDGESVAPNSTDLRELIY